MGDCACQMDLSCFQWDGKGFAFAFLELTPMCNNRCIGCCNVFARQHQPAPLGGEDWEGVITHLASVVKALKLSGGEPTLHHDFDRIVFFVSELGLPFCILTNGRWSEPDRILALLRPMASAVTLLVSLHGPDAPSHEAFSGVRGSFAETVANVVRMAEVGLQVAISTVLTRYNWDRVEEMVTLARSAGADHVVFNRYIGRPLPIIEARPFQVAKAAQEVNRLIAQGEPVRWGTPLPCCFSPAAGNCRAGEAFFTVDPWGNVRPCNHAPYIVGNLRVQSVKEIQHSQRMKAWQTFVPEECLGCTVNEECRGGCRAEAMLRPVLSYPIPRRPYRIVPHVGISGIISEAIPKGS